MKYFLRNAFLIHNLVVLSKGDAKYYPENEESTLEGRRRPPVEDRRYPNDRPPNSREFPRHSKYDVPPSPDRDDGRLRHWDERGSGNAGYLERRLESDWDRREMKRHDWDDRHPPKFEEYKPVWEGPRDRDKPFPQTEVQDDKTKAKIQSFSDKDQEKKNFQKMNCDRLNERFESCFSGCAAVTCDNPRDRMRPCYPFCEPGCICVHPFVRDDRTHKCVMPRDCTRGLKGIPDLGLD